MHDVVRMRRVFRGSHFRANALRADERTTLAPFVGIDHAWLSAPPPHTLHSAEVAVLSYLFLDSETGSSQGDAPGAAWCTAPGGVCWLASLNGATCPEKPAESGKMVHALHVYFEGVPHGMPESPPMMYLAPREVPVFQRPGIRVRVGLGAFRGLRSSLCLPIEATLLDVSLDAGAQVTVDLPKGLRVVVMPILGTLTVAGQRFASSGLDVPVFGPSGSGASIDLVAAGSNCKAVLLAAEPR